MNAMDYLEIKREESLLSIDACNAIRKGIHPRQEILALIQEVSAGTLCEIYVPHRTGPLISALEGLGLNVAIAEVSHGVWRLRMMKM